MNRIGQGFTVFVSFYFFVSVLSFNSNLLNPLLLSPAGDPAYCKLNQHILYPSLFPRMFQNIKLFHIEQLVRSSIFSLISNSKFSKASLSVFAATSFCSSLTVWLSPRNFFQGGKIYCYANVYCYSIVFGPNFREGQKFSKGENCLKGGALCRPCGRKLAVVFMKSRLFLRLEISLVMLLTESSFPYSGQE